MKTDDVIMHQQIMHTWASFALERDPDFYNEKLMESMVEWTEEAIEALKKETVTPILKREGRNKYWSDYVCPVCDTELTYSQNFCSECGKGLKWDD